MRMWKFLVPFGLLLSSTGTTLTQNRRTLPIPYEVIQRAPRSNPWYLRVMSLAGYEISARVTTQDGTFFYEPEQMREMARYLGSLSPLEPRRVLLQVRVPRAGGEPPLVFDFEGDSLETVTGAVLTTHIAYLAIFSDRLPAAEVRYSLLEGKELSPEEFK